VRRIRQANTKPSEALPKPEPSAKLPLSLHSAIADKAPSAVSATLEGFQALNQAGA
jgi:hypothetical protein